MSLPKNQGKAAVNIAQAGGFDMPTGPGNGNGTGGAKGARGVVASTGFGSGVATGDARTSRHEERCGKLDSATTFLLLLPFSRAPRCRGGKNYTGGNPFQAGSHLYR